MTDDDSPDYQIKNPRTVGLAASLGFSIVISLVVCIGLGLLADEWLNTSPWLTLTGVALGLIAAGYQLWELVQVSNNDKSGGPLARSMAKRMEAKQRNKIN